MCLICFSPSGDFSSFGLTAIARVARLNPDGFGLVCPDLSLWYRSVTAGPAEVRAWLDACAGHPAMAHWRLATGGAVGTSMCHPFAAGHGAYLTHNGICLPAQDIAPDGWSDTALIAHTLRGLPNFAAKSAYLASLPLGACVLLASRGRYAVIDGGRGHWAADGRVWCSNYCYTSPSWSVYGYDDPEDWDDPGDGRLYDGGDL